MLKPFLFSLLLVFCIFSCKNKSSESFLKVLEPNTSINQKLKDILHSSTASSLQLSQDQLNFLIKFYEERNYQPLWIKNQSLTERAHLQKRLFKESLILGLPNKRYAFDSLNNDLLLSELSVTNLSSTLIADLTHGFYDFETKSFKKPIPCEINKLKTITSLKTTDFDILTDTIIALTSNQIKSKIIAKKLKSKYKNYKINIPDSDSIFFTKDTLKYLNFAKIKLVEKDYLSQNQDDIEEIQKAIKTFQFEHNLDTTSTYSKENIRFLNQSELLEIKKLALALERSRHTKNAKRYIEVNLPEFKLRFIDSDTIFSEHNVIIGKKETQTPLFNSSLSRIVLFPYWNVPYSIASKEMLKDVKTNPDYFFQNNMKLYENGQEINPNKIIWSRLSEKHFPFKVVQQYGPSNALGIIKFEFKSSLSVYIHDTPVKSLFKKKNRTFSHGCIRCENPITLAQKILELDKNDISALDLDEKLKEEKNQSIKLRNKIPIFIQYESIIIDNKGNVIFLDDVYNVDRDLATKLFS